MQNSGSRRRDPAGDVEIQLTPDFPLGLKEADSLKADPILWFLPDPFSINNRVRLTFSTGGDKGNQINSVKRC